jgi:hypothetical protein
VMKNTIREKLTEERIWFSELEINLSI